MGSVGSNTSKLNIQLLIDTIKANRTNENSIDDLSKYPKILDKPQFTANGNSIKLQGADIVVGDDTIALTFYSQYEPTQVTKPTEQIKTYIDARIYNKGNITALRTITSTQTKSLKNAKANYEKILDIWKKMTNQKQITF